MVTKSGMRRRNKRTRKAEELVERMVNRVEVSSGTVSDKKGILIIGKVDGKILYTSKPIRTHHHGARLKKSWLRRI